MNKRHNGILGLIRLMKGQRHRVLLAVVAGVLAQGGTLASLALGAVIAGQAIVAPDADTLITGCAGMALLVLFTAGARWWQGWASHDLAFMLIEKLQMAIFDGLERAAPSTASGQRLGELASVATADAERMERFYAHTLADYIAAFIVPLAALALLYLLDPLLMLVMLPFLLLVASVPAWLARHAARQGKAVTGQLGQLNAATLEFIHGLRELALFGQTQIFVQRLLQRTRQLSLAQQRYAARSGLEQAAIDLLSASALLAMLLCTLHLLLAGALMPQWLPLVAVLSIGALLPIAEVTHTASELGELHAGAGRILTLANQDSRVKDQGTAALPDNADVMFSAVSFAYPGRPPLLHQVDFHLKRGEMVALVGRSGAGKSTLSQLLLRLHEATEGTITIGGSDIRTLPLARLHQLISWVPQDIDLFATSIADNIRLGQPEASQQQVEQAARLAQAHDFICALPDGYATSCSGADRLSGGQRQRIAIARALLTTAPILILDEASASLDSENERAFHQALDAIRQQRTVLLIAHRPSTIQRADRIIQLVDGVII
ncbi:ABC transporter ATP-binding protein [Pseudomonas graminis]